jgi:hypothetical protein
MPAIPQLYPLSRLAEMDDQQLHDALTAAWRDLTGTSHSSVRYGPGINTAAARRAVADITTHQNYRAAMRFSRQATLDELHGQALAEYTAGRVEELRPVVFPPVSVQHGTGCSCCGAGVRQWR